MRGASRGVLEVGQVRRPRACLASTHSGGPGSPSVPTTGDCLQWLDAARTKGGESCPDRGGRSPPVRARKLRPRGQKSPPWSAEWRARLRRARRRHQASGLMVAPPGAPFPSHACRVYPICADKKCGRLRKAPLSGDGNTAYPAPPRIRAIAHVHSIRSSPRKQGPSSGCPLARA